MWTIPLTKNKEKTEKLLEKLAFIEKENDDLFSRLNEKEEKIRTYKNELEKMQEENRLLKISNDFRSGKNSGIAKQKIASLVKEIDTCVKVLDGLE